VPQTARENPPTIRRLDDLLINQIAAGEVIERPASVVKELVENALDAGATRITVELERGGIELIRVTDDGYGIVPGQLALALGAHATSKITRAQDLDAISTMGFRGEALASIASVARVSIRSRPRGHDEAREIHAEGDSIGTPIPAAGPHGTQVTVRNLFFNTPARRKFLRTPGTEQGRCIDWLRDLAMARPHIAFRVTTDTRAAMDLPAQQGPRARIVDLLGSELDNELIEASFDRYDDPRGITIWGLIGTPSLARATPRAQHVFINGRAVRDRTIAHAVREAYRGLIEHGRHPTAVLMIEMGPDAVDVNVHPAKLEVRFRDQSLVHEAVRRCVKDALARADLTPRVGADAGHAARGPVSDREIMPSSGHRGGSGRAGAVDAAAFAQALRTPTTLSAPERERLRVDSLREALAIVGPQRDDEAGNPPGSEASPPGRESSEALTSPVPASGVLRVHNSYIVTEDERGVVIIDQHALHERVMFEKLLARVESEPLESQRLLTPAVVEGSAVRAEALELLKPMLGRLGIDIEPIGPASLGVFAFPTLLFERGVEPGSFVADLLDRTGAEGLGSGNEEALHEVLDMMACKAAVKAGDRLSHDEIAELLAQRERVERSGSCPHGRPTTVRLTIDQLERLFHRR